MRHLRSLLVLAAATVAAPALIGQEAKEAIFRVLVPIGATVQIDGIKTKQSGTVRTFVTPALKPGKNYFYIITASWVEDGKTIQRKEKVQVVPGQETELDLRPASAKAESTQVFPESPYVPTPQEVVEKMLELAKVTKDDVVFDLGCGDGRIPVTAAKKYGARGVGVDIDPERIKESKENAQKNQVTDKVEIRQADVMDVKDLGKATVLTLYLLPDHIKKLEPNLKQQLKPGTRIVAHDFPIEDWKPDQEVNFKGERREHMLFVYQVPGKAPKKLRQPDILFVPTPQAVVDRMLELAKVTKDDVVYDLGCGDGRIPVTAAKKHGCKAIGFDIDPERIKDSNANVKKNNVGDKVTIKHADIFEEDLTPASVVTLYLLPSLNVKLIPQLEKLKPGSRIVSHDFNMAGIKPDHVETIKAKDDDGGEREHEIYLWTVPLKKE